MSGTETYPKKIAGLSNIVKIAAAGHSAYVLTADGKVYAWGRNNAGQMGISADSLADQGTPQLVKNEDGTGVLSDILAIAAGGYTDSATFALALDKDGQVYGWGSNDRGQIVKASDR